MVSVREKGKRNNTGWIGSKKRARPSTAFVQMRTENTHPRAIGKLGTLESNSRKGMEFPLSILLNRILSSSPFDEPITKTPFSRNEQHE